MALGMEIVIGAAVVLFLAIVIGYIMIIFNSLISLKNNIDRSWANIDVLLKQRTDELPNLVETVKGYMKHEREVLENVTKARAAIMHAQTVGEKAEADNLISEALKTIFAVAEKYPNLKANENFLKLQARISGLENEIADRREFYNDSVTNYNIRIESVPDLIVAGLMKFQIRELFKIGEDEKQPVKVAF
ncbi:MAG: LemA family protein [Candidatus Diapherotrites archaeon]